MKFLHSLLFAFIILFSFTSCDELGELFPGPKEFSFVMVNHDLTAEKIENGQHYELTVGDYLNPCVSDGRDWWGVREDNAQLSISNPSALMYYDGMLYGIHGGESSVTIVSGEHEISFTVSVPKGPSHGTIYYTCRDVNAGGPPREDEEEEIDFSDKLLVNGVVTDETCHFISSDSQGNLWQGVLNNGEYLIKHNGRDLGVSFAKPYPDMPWFPKEFVRTRHGKFFYFHQNNYSVISPDGTRIDGSIPWGGIIDMDEDDNGNLHIWVWSMVPSIMTVSPDGTTSSYELPTVHILISGALDSKGNEYSLVNIGDGTVTLFKNEQAIYSLKDTYDPKMIVRGTDVFIAAYSPDGEPDEAGNIVNWGLYLAKNKEVIQIAKNIFSPDGIDCCISKNGDLYILANSRVYKETTPVLFIPFVNIENPQFAVVD